MARIMMEFKLDYDVDIAAQDVRDKINMSLDELPDDIDPPILGKADFSMFPIIYAPITSELDQTDTTEYVDRHPPTGREHPRGRRHGDLQEL